MEIMLFICLGLGFIEFIILLAILVVSYGLTNETKWAKECEDEIK